MDTLRDKLKDEIDRPAITEVGRTGMAAVLVVVIVASGVGYLIYRRRRRLSLAGRLRNALPDVDDLRASIRHPLERVVKAL